MTPIVASIMVRRSRSTKSEATSFELWNSMTLYRRKMVVAVATPPAPSRKTILSFPRHDMRKLHVKDTGTIRTTKSVGIARHRSEMKIFLWFRQCPSTLRLQYDWTGLQITILTA